MGPRLLLLSTIFFAAACGSTSDDDAGTPRDGGAGQDAGLGQDSGVSDSGQVACDPNVTPTLVELRSSGGLYTNPHFAADSQRVAVLSWSGFTVSDAIILDRCGAVLRSLSVGAELAGVSNYGPTSDLMGRVYYSTRDDEIKRVPESGAAELLVSNTFSTSFDAASNGNLIVYEINTGLAVRDLTTSNVVELGVRGASPRFSTTADRVAYIDSGHLFTIGVDASNLTDVYTFADNLEAGSVDWLPNGDFILSTRNGIEKITADGQARIMLFAEPLARDVDVSRDGTQVVYGLNGQPKVVLRSL